MHFAIGTKNTPKKEAVETVLSSAPYTKDTPYSISYHSVGSGVPDMPTTLRELRSGAKNRATYTRREMPDADFFVGMEGGVYQDSEGEEYWLIGVVYIENALGEGNFGYSCHLRVPEKVTQGLFDGRGRDLEEVMHELSGVENIGDKKGSYALWTDGMLTRQHQFILAFQCALSPFFNTFYSKL